MSNPADYPFKKAKDVRGHEIRGIWERNGRFYASLRYPGKKSASMVPLVDEHNQAAETVAQAVIARGRLVQERRQGKTPSPRITPQFDEYVQHYLAWIETTEAKSKLTIKVERWALQKWADYFGTLRLSQISARNIDEYLALRKTEDKIHNRTLNLQIIALRNLFKFAKRQGYLKYELPTQELKTLRYRSPKRSLLPDESIERICVEALRTEPDPEGELTLRIMREYRQQDGSIDWRRAWMEHPDWQEQLRAKTPEGRQTLYARANYLANNPDAPKAKPVHSQGEMLADWVKLMAYSGARRTAALHARWEHVDWRNRQLHLFTKRDKEVVVDFNPKLEAHLKVMHQRRVPTDDAGTLSPFLFPSPRQGDSTLGHMTNFQKTLHAVRIAAKLPAFNPHDLRHYFISMCVMEGFDYMTIAEWVGHSDGGVLIGKVYGHLNPGHKRELAARLSFGAKATPAENPANKPSSQVDLSKLSVADLLKMVQGVAGSSANQVTQGPQQPAADAPQP
jgi:integrase